MITLFINLLIVLGIIAILWWGYTEVLKAFPGAASGPFRIVLVIFIVIVAIALLLWLGGMLPLAVLHH